MSRHKPKSRYHVDTLQVVLNGLRGGGRSKGAKWSVTSVGSYAVN